MTSGLAGLSPPAQAWVALGANLGNAATTLRQAIATLDTSPSIRVAAASSLYRTRPIDAPGPDYYNAVVRLATDLDPHALLARLMSIEQRFGRQRTSVNAPRTLDLDLLLHQHGAVASPSLTLPHPRMHLREFVLAPLSEIDPTLEIPGLGRVDELLARAHGQGVTRVPDEPPKT